MLQNSPPSYLLDPKREKGDNDPSVVQSCPLIPLAVVLPVLVFLWYNPLSQLILLKLPSSLLLSNCLLKDKAIKHKATKWKNLTRGCFQCPSLTLTLLRRSLASLIKDPVLRACRSSCCTLKGGGRMHINASNCMLTNYADNYTWTAPPSLPSTRHTLPHLSSCQIQKGLWLWQYYESVCWALAALASISLLSISIALQAISN